MENSKTQKPIVCFDIEATGTDTKYDRIVELAMIKVQNGEIIETFEQRINPTVPIPNEATEVHGITDEDVRLCPTFIDIAHKVDEFIDGCDFMGFNLYVYDIPMLNNELNRAGIYFDFQSSNILDVGNLFKIFNPRTLVAAVKQYCNKDLEDAHGAMPDTLATYEVFKAMSEQHCLEDDFEKLSVESNYGKRLVDVDNKFYEKDGDIYFNFGNDRDKEVSTNYGFVRWMLTKDFSESTKQVCRNILEIDQSNGLSY